ncbi:MAG: hypothetical protein QXZ58_05215, partial [Candidatus Nezhaarchaeales archaeon]
MGSMKPNVFRVVVFSFLILILIFFICVFTSPAIFVDPWQLAYAFISDEVRFALSLSIFTATCSTLISLVIGIPVAYALSRLEFRGKTVIEGFLDVPIAVPPVALGVMLLIFFARNPLGMFINESVVRIVFEVPGIIVAQLAVISALTIK